MGADSGIAVVATDMLASVPEEETGCCSRGGSVSGNTMFAWSTDPAEENEALTFICVDGIAPEVGEAV